MLLVRQPAFFPDLEQSSGIRNLMKMVEKQREKKQKLEDYDVNEVLRATRARATRYPSQENQGKMNFHQSRVTTFRYNRTTTAVWVVSSPSIGHNNSQSGKYRFRNSFVDDIGVRHLGPEISRLIRKLQARISMLTFVATGAGGSRLSSDRDIQHRMPGGEQKVYSSENVPEHWCSAGENNLSELKLHLRVFNDKQEDIDLAVAFVDFGADITLISESRARRQGWNGFTLVENDLLQRLLELQIHQSDGRPMVFLGIHTMNAVIKETGQELQCVLQVVPDEQMREADIILDRALARREGLFQG